MSHYHQYRNPAFSSSCLLQSAQGGGCVFLEYYAAQHYKHFSLAASWGLASGGPTVNCFGSGTRFLQKAARIHPIDGLIRIPL